MTFDWYLIFNLTEWNSTGLVSRTLEVNLEDRGTVEIQISKGNSTNILIGDVFLPLNFADKNPFSSDGMAVYVDGVNDVYLGYEVSQ